MLGIKKTLKQLISLLLSAETCYLGRSLEGTGLLVPEDYATTSSPPGWDALPDNITKAELPS